MNIPVNTGVMPSCKLYYTINYTTEGIYTTAFKTFHKRNKKRIKTHEWPTRPLC